jgi:hypothetical protein
MDAERIEAIRRNASNQVAVCKDFAQRKSMTQTQISDEEWEAIQVPVEADHAISRKRARTNYTWLSTGYVKAATKKRIKLEAIIKASGMTLKEWNAIQLTPAPKAKPRAILIKRTPKPTEGFTAPTQDAP